MRIISNIMTLLFIIGVVALLLYYLLPRIQFEEPQGLFHKKDVPLPTSLHPIVEERKDELVATVEEKGIDIVITEGHRSIDRQDKLYEQGRSTEGSIVTYAEGGESYHNYGLAIDFALKTDQGQVIWDTGYDGNENGQSDWMEIVEVAKDQGFDWGGDWENFKDYPHLQMDFGLSIRELKNGKRPKAEEHVDGR